MEHLTGHEELRVTIEAARALLGGAPDAGAAREAFDRDLAEAPAEPPTVEAIIALAARHLQVTLKRERIAIVDEFHARLTVRGQLDSGERLAVTQAALRAMTRELRRASGQRPAADDLFLRTTAEWSNWTAQLLRRHDATSREPVTDVYDRRPWTPEELQRLRDNDPTTWDVIFAEYAETVRRFARYRKVPAHAVDEIVNRTFKKAISSRAGLRGHHGHSIYAWLATIAHTTVADHERERRRDRRRERPGSELPDDRGLDAYHLVSIDTDVPVEDAALAFEAATPAELRTALTEVINRYLAPVPDGLAAFVGEPDDGTLPAWLVSPELGSRRTVHADSRTVLAAAINLLMMHAQADDVAIDRMLSAVGAGHASSRARDAVRAARVTAEKHDGADALAHRARISAPSALYAARQALRAWLDDHPVTGRTQSDATSLWRALWLIERSCLIKEFEAISVQFAGSLNRLNGRRIRALLDWSSTTLAELAQALEHGAGRVVDDAWSGSRDRDLERELQAAIRRTLSALVDHLENGPEPIAEKIDPSRDGNPGTTDAVARAASVAHYRELYAVVQLHRIS